MKSKNSKLIVQNSVPNLNFEIFCRDYWDWKKKWKTCISAWKSLKKNNALKFFGVKEFFLWILISKIDFKMNLRIITKNLGRVKNRVPLKIDFRADWTYESNSTAWELNRYEPEIKDLCYINVNRKLWFPPENS